MHHDSRQFTNIMNDNVTPQPSPHPLRRYGISFDMREDTEHCIRDELTLPVRDFDDNVR